MEDSMINFSVTQISIERLLADKKSERMTIPEHQRNPTVWSDLQRRTLIDSLRQRIPIPSILLYELDDTHLLSIEDGLQRLTTMESFVANKFVDLAGNTFSTWTEAQQRRFLDYPVPVLKYSGLSLEQRGDIYDRFQNGSPLRVGERLKSLSFTPLVAFTRKMFYDHDGPDGQKSPGVFAERYTKMCGAIKVNLQDKRCNEFLSLVALINGAAHGFRDGGGISKKYLDLKKNLYTVVDEAETTRVINELLSIYEEADSVNQTVQISRTAAKKIQTAQHDIGKFTGPIIYSLKQYPTEWVTLRKGWVDVLVDFRSDEKILPELVHAGLSSARSWNNKRWANAYKNVFGDDIEESSNGDGEEDDEDEDDEDGENEDE